MVLDIVKLKNRLEGLAPRLAAVLEATKPLQEHLGLPIDKIRAEHKLASLLSDPLYLLYANVDAYKSVYSKCSIKPVYNNCFKLHFYRFKYDRADIGRSR